VERLESCQYKQDQAEARLAELKKQTYNLPRVFPWPGLGERRQVVEQAQALLDQSASLAPVLSDVCAQVKTGNTAQQMRFRTPAVFNVVAVFLLPHCFDKDKIKSVIISELKHVYC